MQPVQLQFPVFHG